MLSIDSIDIRIDSNFLNAFAHAHNTVTAALKDCSRLNPLQYSALVTLGFSKSYTLTSGALSNMLHVKRNVTAHVLSVLHERQYIDIAIGEKDARQHVINITPLGYEHILSVNQALTRRLYSMWPTDDPRFRPILEQSVDVATQLHSISPERDFSKAIASFAMTSIEMAVSAIDHEMRIQTQLNLKECRMLLHLSEQGMPVRARDLASQILLNNPACTRISQSLEKMGYIQRLLDPHDAKAVYFTISPEQKDTVDHIKDALDSIISDRLWSIMTPEQRVVFSQVGSLVMADVKRRKEVERIAALNLLIPVPPTQSNCN